MVFATLSRQELKFLEARLDTVELQAGCRHQCLGCGSSAQKPGPVMSWEMYSEIMVWIKEIHEREGLNLFRPQQGFDFMHPDGYFTLFWASDPMSYRTVDKQGKVRTIWDAAQLLFDIHGRKTDLTTYGWKSTQSDLENAARQLVADFKHGRAIVRDINYSIKPFGLHFRSDFDRFVKAKEIDPTVRYEEFKEKYAQEFFASSSFVANMLANMRTLEGAPVLYTGQCLAQDDTNNLPQQLYRYRTFFSENMMVLLLCYCREEVGNITVQGQARPFEGVGKASQDLGIVSTSFWDRLGPIDEYDYEHLETVEEIRYAIKINYDGTLQILPHGNGESIEDVVIPQRYFEQTAQFFEAQGERAKVEHYRMLAGLQGRKLFY